MSGVFDSVFIGNTSIDSTFAISHSIISNIWKTNVWDTLIGSFPDTINVLYRSGNVLYCGGNSIFDTTKTEFVLLSRYYNEIGINFPLEYIWGHTKINAISEYPYGSGNLLLGGKFNVGFGIEGQNLGRLKLTSNYFEPYANLDGEVFSIINFEQNLYLGGAFSHNTFIPCPYFTRIKKPNDNVFEYIENKIQIYPNPTSENINFTIPQNFNCSHISITDNLGRIVYQNENVANKDQNSIDVRSFGSGFYTITLFSKDNNWIKSKFIIE